jgi:hypothetical protein
MDKLEKVLREEAVKPNQTAVKFTKANEFKLCREHNIGRGALRQIAVMLDKQTLAGFKVEETAKRKARKVAQKEEKLKTAEAPMPKKAKKADAEPPKPKAKAKAKPKVKAKAKKKSKPKG